MIPESELKSEKDLLVEVHWLLRVPLSLKSSRAISRVTVGLKRKVLENCRMFWLAYSKFQTRPLVREGAPQKQDRKFQTATFRQEVISGHKSHKSARYQDILTE
jgi:hypothetical protein